MGLLCESEMSILDDFLAQMMELNILENVGRKVNERYIFTNRLYFVYFLIIANVS